MPPIHDDARSASLHALMGLEADLDRALNGSADRAALREIAAEMRGVLTRANEMLGETETDDLHEIADRARDKVIKALGTSAWDEPVSQAGARQAPGGGPDPKWWEHAHGHPPLTDLELEELEDFFENLPNMEPLHERDARKVAVSLGELRRLRKGARKA
jgi:hypothetical protein